MSIRQWFTIMVTGFAIITSSNAQEADNNDTIGVILSSGVYSKYHTDDGHLWYDDEVVQSDLWIDIADGWWIDLWNSTGIERNEHPNYGDELDLGFGKSSEVPFGNLDIGVYYFDTPELLKFNSSSDVWRVHAEFTADSLSPYDDLSVEPFVKIQAYECQTENWDSVVFAGVKVGWNITEKLSMDAKTYVMYDSGLWDNVSGYVVGARVGAHYSLTDDLMIDITGNYTDPLKEDDYRNGDQTSWSAGLTYSF